MGLEVPGVASVRVIVGEEGVSGVCEVGAVVSISNERFLAGGEGASSDREVIGL